MSDESVRRIIAIVERHVQTIEANPIEGIHDEELISSYKESIKKMKNLLDEDSAE